MKYYICPNASSSKKAPKEKKMEPYQWLALLLIFGAYVVLSVPHLSNHQYWAPDADRIGMDGVFLLDFIKDLPLSLIHLYDYTVEYYAKYPALSIGYRPIFFPLIEAIFYALFGVSHLSAKMAVMFFLFIAMIFWFLLVSQIYGSSTAILSLLFWLMNPFIYRFAQQNMLELPTIAMCIVSVYFLFKFESNSSVRYAVILGIVVGLTLWTNQKSGFILLLLFIYPIVKKNIKLLLLKNTWLAAIFILCFLVPLVCITLWLGEKNLGQSIGYHTSSVGGQGGVNLFSQFQVFRNLSYLYLNHFPLPILALIALGMLISCIHKDRKCLLFLSTILSIYLFFTIIKTKIPRYPMYWIPFFSLFAALGLEFIIRHIEKVLKYHKIFVRYMLFGLPVVLQVGFWPNVIIGYAGGYEEAAIYSMQNSKSPVLFFEGYANGQFIFFVKKHDLKRQFVILRGSKIITSSSLNYRDKLIIHLNDADDIYRTLSDLNVHIVVVESVNTSGIGIYDELLELLCDTSRFALRKTVNIKTNIKSLIGQDLLIYENLNYNRNIGNQTINLRLPLVGKSVQVKLKKITPN
jgi:hypothetical protein